MRRFLLPALLLAACSSSGSGEVPPTLHVLDTPTEDPNFGGGSDFVTNTPGGPGEDDGGDTGSLPSETPPAAFASPTPEAPADPGDLPAACTDPGQNAAIAAADAAALRAQLDPLLNGLRGAAATLNGWTLTTGDDSFAAQIAGSLGDDLPTGTLAYSGPNGEQAFFILAYIPDAALDYWRACVLSGEVFVIEGGPLADGSGTLDPLDMGDGGLLLEVESPDAAASGLDALAVRWGISQVGNISVWYLESPVLAAAQGGVAASQAEAVGLLTAMVSAVRGQ